MSDELEKIERLLRLGYSEEVEKALIRLSKTKLNPQDKIWAADIASKINREDIARSFLLPVIAPMAANSSVSPAKAHPLVQETLRNNLLFFCLDDAALEEIMAASNVLKLATNEPLKESFKDVYVIISGRMFIKRTKNADSTQEIILGASYSFGGLDPLMGLGTCIEVLTIDDAEIMQVPDDVFNRFFIEMPQLQQHISSLKRSLEILDLPAKKKEAVSQHTDSAIRRGGRFSLLDSPSFAHVKNKGRFQIKDISISGLFLLNFQDCAIGEEVTLDVQQLDMTMVGKLSRITPEGAGISLLFENQAQKESWLKFISWMSTQVQLKEFQSQIFPISTPVPMQVQSRATVYQAKLVALSELFVILECTSELEVGQECAVFGSLPLSGSTKSVKFVATVKDSTAKGYKLRIERADPYVYEAFNKFLDAREAVQESAEKLPEKYHLHELTFTRPDEFSTVFQDQITQSILLIRSGGKLELETLMRVRLKVRMPGINKHEIFNLDGKVTRFMGESQYLITLDPLESYTSRKISRIMSIIQADQNYSVAENVVDKYATSNSLILALLIATVVLFVPILMQLHGAIARYEIRHDTLELMKDPTLAYRGVLFDIVDFENFPYRKTNIGFLVFMKKGEGILRLATDDGETTTLAQKDLELISSPARNLVNSIR